ncbi:hypothetical protein BDV12DRAFT_186490 [Aspergillus spectabilis]
MDYERCAARQNDLFLRGRTGRGKSSSEPPPTWWEAQSPSESLVSRLYPSLVEFLKRAYRTGPADMDDISMEEYWKQDEGLRNLFYFISCLMPASALQVDGLFSASEPDRFLALYSSSGFHGDDQGFVFNQHTLKATFIADLGHTDTMPLEVILDAYLQMIDEGKVWAVPDDQLNDAEDEWEYHNPEMLNQDFIPPSSFAYEFLPPSHSGQSGSVILPQAYAFQRVSKFLKQPITEFAEGYYKPIGNFPGDSPLRMFQIDNNEQPFCFEIECLLNLPFGIGSNGWARHSNGQRFGVSLIMSSNAPGETHGKLYQSGDYTTGFTNSRLVQLHKVLQNWAERVEKSKDK